MTHFASLIIVQYPHQHTIKWVASERISEDCPFVLHGVWVWGVRRSLWKGSSAFFLFFWSHVRHDSAGFAVVVVPVMPRSHGRSVIQHFRVLAANYIKIQQAYP